MVASSRNYDMSDIRPVYFDDDSDSWDSYKFDSDNVFKRVPKKFKRGPKKDLAKEKIRAIVSVLDLYSVLEDMSYEDQEALIADLAAVIYSRDS